MNELAFEQPDYGPVLEAHARSGPWPGLKRSGVFPVLVLSFIGALASVWIATLDDDHGLLPVLGVNLLVGSWGLAKLSHKSMKIARGCFAGVAVAGISIAAIIYNARSAMFSNYELGELASTDEGLAVVFCLGCLLVGGFALLRLRGRELRELSRALEWQTVENGNF